MSKRCKEGEDADVDVLEPFVFHQEVNKTFDIRAFPINLADCQFS